MIAVVVLVLVGLTVLVAVVTSRGSSLPSSVSIRSDELPAAYRIVYEVRTSGGPDRPATQTTEILQVSRPFRSLAVTRAGDALSSGRLTDLNRLAVFNGGRWQELQVPPAMAGSDLRLEGDVLSALERRDEVRPVAGRPCQVYRAGGPVSAGDVLAVGDGDDGETAELCIDAAGLVLSEAWMAADDSLLRSRVAVDVDVDPDFDADTFTIEDAEVLAATEGGGSAVKVDDDEPFGDRTLMLGDDALPAGFDLVGRWSIVHPKLSAQPADPFADPTEGRVAGIATVWVRGIDAVVLEQGGVAGGDRAFQPHPRAEEVDLGELLDVGEVVTDARGTEVRVAYTDGSYVRVWSTLPRSQVLDLSRSLTPQ